MAEFKEMVVETMYKERMRYHLNKWNPQWKFTFHKKKQKFQGFLLLKLLLYPYCLLVEALNEMRI